MPRRRYRASHIERRYNTYYAVLDIPKAVRPIIGKSRFFKSLKTESLVEAALRAPKLIAAWKLEVEKARKHLGLIDSDPMEAEARYWRSVHQDAETDEQRASIRDHLGDLARDIDEGYLRNLPFTGAPTSSNDAIRFLDSATGQIIRTDEHLEGWLNALGHIKPKTRDMRSATVQRLTERFPTLNTINGKSVYQWTSELLQGEQALAPATVRRMISDCRSYWRHVQALGDAPADLDPFDGKSISLSSGKQKAGAGKPKRLAFSAQEVVQLHRDAELKGDQKLADLIELAMWTGCRREELCSLPLANVVLNGRNGGSIKIEKAKTAAGSRSVPVHPKLVKTLARLIDASKDGYILSDLTENKYEDRGNAIGKRFGQLKTHAGFGGQHVFHSIRKTVVTILENAGVPEGVVADIVGHEKTTMTYGLYSGGATLETKREALRKLKYPVSSLHA